MTDKVFNDPIHGHIELPELCVSIIDTPQFQRLRYIKQLGGAYFVYPGASHNRFEHSIGVCHLAGELTKKLQKSQTDLDITDEDVLCLQIAGLCHDLGHGPFSHLFDKYFLPVFERKYWKHETGSVHMFDHMLEENPEFKSKLTTRLAVDVDITFIKELIDGSGRQGRPETKYFLYEIVNNARTGVDVDKWDYFARDCHHLGMKNAFDHNRLIKFARIATDDKGQKQLCTREKEVLNLYDMFYTRNLLHRRAYQHKTTAIIEYMIAEALHEANEYIRIPVEPNLGHPTIGIGSHGVRMSETILKDNMKAFTTLNDSIYLTILHSTSDELKRAREILERIERRRHYRYIDYYKVKSNDQKLPSSDDMKKRIIEQSKKNPHSKLTENNIVVLEAMFSYGKKDQDPVKAFFVYSKKEPDTARTLNEDEVSKMLPAEFCESVLRLYCKDETEDVRKEAQECWDVVRRTLDGPNAN